MKTPKKVVVSTIPDNVTVNLDQLPAHESDALCRTLIHSVTEYFKLPGVAADYARWKAARLASEKCKRR